MSSLTAIKRVTFVLVCTEVSGYPWVPLSNKSYTFMRLEERRARLGKLLCAAIAVCLAFSFCLRHTEVPLELPRSTWLRRCDFPHKNRYSSCASSQIHIPKSYAYPERKKGSKFLASSRTSFQFCRLVGYCAFVTFDNVYHA
jgi:hypothetical protein